MSPFSRIKNIFPSGGEVDVVLQKEVEINEDGSTVSSEWSMRAFTYSRKGREKLDAMDQLREHSEKNTGENDSKERLQGYVRQLVCSEFPTAATSWGSETLPIEIINDFEDQWKGMKLSSLFRSSDNGGAVSYCVPLSLTLSLRISTCLLFTSPVTQAKNVTMREYKLIIAIYNHFCGSCSRDNACTMSYSEFLRFVKYLSNLSLEHEKDLVDEIFRESNSEKFVSSYSNTLMYFSSSHNPRGTSISMVGI